MPQKPRRIAIIGFGPRGLGALEALVNQASDANADLLIEVFEPGEWPAAGPNFSPDETPICLLNLPLRSVDLPVAPLPRGVIGSFEEWLREDGKDGEAYLPRAQFGTYLTERFNALLSHLPNRVHVLLHRARINKAERSPDGWTLQSRADVHGPFNQVLISLGQPETEYDSQLLRWRDHANTHELSLVSVYPGSKLVEAAREWAGKTVAIRGLALSALDAIRVLTLGLGGRFESGSYVPSGHEPERILPFSFDGHAPAPKPKDASIDAKFEPLPEETENFADALREILASSDCTDLGPLFGVLEAVTSRVISTNGGIFDAPRVRRWLRQELEDPGGQESRGTCDALKANIEQAEGNVAPEIGYTVGQLWRKWQRDLRSIYDAERVSPDVADTLVNFDEGLKRYSYGAPIEAAKQLLILIDAGRVSPQVADDPDIRLSKEGWTLESEGGSITASVMIDSVLPQPELDSITEPLIADLRRNALIVPIGDGLGAHTFPNAQMVGPDGCAIEGLSLVGRLANGSAIAGDSVHDCFGDICARWASYALR